MESLKNNIAKNSGSYGSIPFWSWNDKLEPQELRRQIRNMKGIGMNGFFMHARGGLETEYLGEDWFKCVDACVDEAKKLGMEAWAYDENGWPSGFAGGILLQDKRNHAAYVKLNRTQTFPAGDDVLGVYTLKDNKLTYLTAPDGSEEYLSVIIGFDSSYVDTLDAEITKKFIKETHQKYKERCGDDFGGAMPGFFTDEPQYYRWATPYSLKLPAEFKNKYGYDIKPLLAALFVDCEGADEFRYDYYYLIHTLFMNNFIKVIYDWCSENGIKITGHAVEESFLAGQMWCCGGVMPFYQYEDIPGMDYLGRGIANDLAPKQLGSACAQLGKKKVLSEMFACCGWDVSPRELKKIAELQYAGGVNLMCGHLYAYSERGQRKRDYPAHYSEHLPWQEKLKDFHGFFNNLGYTLSLGHEAVNTLVIHPIHSAYLKYKRAEDMGSIAELEEQTVKLSNLLSRNQIGYHYGDESMMAAMASVDGNKINVGLCSYDYVIIPCCYTLDGTTVKLLKEYIANGGKVWMFGKAPERIDGRIADMTWLTSNTDFDVIKDSQPAAITLNGEQATGLRMQIRDTEFGRIYYIANISNEAYEDCKLVTKSGKPLYRLEMRDLTVHTVHGTPGDAVFTLEEAVSGLFIEDDSAVMDNAPVKKPGTSIKLGDFMFEELPENQFTLDYAEVSFDGVNYEETRPIVAVKDMLFKRRYKGELYLKFKFNIDEKPETLRTALEPMKYKSVTVNGTPLMLEDVPFLDKSFKSADIIRYVKTGVNDITVSLDYFQRDYVYYVLYGGVSESLRNCLCFDTEIESIYLYGKFALKTDSEKFKNEVRNSVTYTGDFSITEQKNEIDVNDIVKDGYPFFAGSIRVSTVYNYKPGMPTELKLTGRFAVCDVAINDKFVKELMFRTHRDLAEYLTEGENKITLTLYNSNRNLLGPHHRHDPEPYALGPNTFSFENEWDENGRECRGYNPRYAFVRFGFEK